MIEKYYSLKLDRYELNGERKQEKKEKEKAIILILYSRN